ncbi:hypothetical protein DYBT9275_04424 [Dyadobacter sp. CECT 9275]|uniref:Uncharacterized protein n=1 Tax=Dyadobacter helix TaxID=2822344 RepID=A0A916JFX8_9BACT|nr:hypothetical protein DYBT9275_04424 [Dyadobacter sp. CECT 9275]
MKTTKIWDVDHVHPAAVAPVERPFQDVEAMEPAEQVDAIK